MTLDGEHKNKNQSNTDKANNSKTITIQLKVYNPIISEKITILASSNVQVPCPEEYPDTE